MRSIRHLATSLLGLSLAVAYVVAPTTAQADDLSRSAAVVKYLLDPSSANVPARSEVLAFLESSEFAHAALSLRARAFVIFPHLAPTPTDAEVQAYAEDPQFAPTQDEIDAYLKEPEAEQDTPSGEVEITPMATFWSNSYFAYGKWINRSKVWSLSLMPTHKLTGHASNIVPAWNTVEARFSSSQHWRAYAWADNSMFGQYLCHVKYGTLKTPYNLEPSKKTFNAITCN